MEVVNTFRKDTILLDDITKHTKYCNRCGHSILFQRNTKRILCSYCGYWVYNYKIDEFKDRLIENIKRLEND